MAIIQFIYKYRTHQTGIKDGHGTSTAHQEPSIL